MGTNSCSEISLPHPHAENMRLYAEDAAKSAKPWENWQWLNMLGDWQDCLKHPCWITHQQYRRKPKTVTKWCIIWQNLHTKEFSGSPYKYDSANEALRAAPSVPNVTNWKFAGTASFTYEE